MRPARLVVLALLAGLLSACSPGGADGSCGTLVSQVADPGDPLMTPALMDQRPEPHRDALRAAVAGWGAPFGPVLAGVDYNYDQWLHLYAVTGGTLAFTKRNAPVTFLSDEDAAPVWALRPSTKQIAWDASDDTFVMLTLPAKKPIEVQAFDLASGAPRWCFRMKSFYEDGDPLTTDFLDDGSVLVAAKSGSSAEVVRLSGDHGKVLWRTLLPSVDRADFVGRFGSQVVVGGREDHHLASGQFPAPGGPSLTGVEADTGTFRWRYTPRGTAHVLGVDGAHLLLLEHDSTTRLVALKSNGRVAWTHRVPAGALQSTLRGGVVVLKAANAYLGYQAASGKPLWRLPIPQKTTFTPYGFTLGEMPSLDSTHLLLPTTTELWVLDVLSGQPSQRFPMPTDGINTTYWPYQLLATPRVLGVVTNTGAVLARRE